MLDIILYIWFIVIFLVASYGVYKLLWCFNFEKFVLPDKMKQLKILVTLVAIIIGFFLAFAFDKIARMLIDIIIE